MVWAGHPLMELEKWQEGQTWDCGYLYQEFPGTELVRSYKELERDWGGPQVGTGIKGAEDNWRADACHFFLSPILAEQARKKEAEHCVGCRRLWVLRILRAGSHAREDKGEIREPGLWS